MRVTCSILLSCSLTGVAVAQPVTTVITHGYSLDATKGVWVEAMAQAILARAGGGGAVCRYDQESGGWRLVSGVIDADEPIVLIARWLDDFEKAGPNWRFAEAAADALHAALRDASFVDSGGAPIAGFDLLAGRDVHFIGHSRGACVNSEITRRLGLAGISVDQVTSLDPHPVNGTLDAPLFSFNWGDPVPQRWSNVAWADNYWRADGGGLVNGFDFDGIPLDATFNVELVESVLDCCAYSLSHSDTHLWYHGTIDLSPGACDGEQCITGQMLATWWPPPGASQSGFFHSVIGGGSGARPAIAGAPAVPPPVGSPVNGSFDQGSFAGWLYHGGSVSGQIVVVSGNGRLRLGAGVGPSATHNRFVLEPEDDVLRFSTRVTTADPAGDDQLRVVLRRGGEIVPLATIRLNAADGWVGHQAVVPASAQRGRAYTLNLTIDPGAAPAAVVEIDDLVFESSPANPADLNLDGAVNGLDLGILLSQWGTAGPADLNGDNVVNGLDLGILLASWTL
jgi:hypothetical protein